MQKRQTLRNHCAVGGVPAVHSQLESMPRRISTRERGHAPFMAIR